MSVGGSYLGGLTWVTAALTAATLVHPFSQAHAQAAARPLGILILPDGGTAVPTAPESSGSVLPNDAFARSPVQPSIDSGSTAPATTLSDRPLGTLLPQSGQGTTGSGSVLPDGWSGTAPQRNTAAPQVIRRAARVPGAGGSNRNSARPLGTLFGAMPAAQQQQTPQRPSAPQAIPAVRTSGQIAPAPTQPVQPANAEPAIPAELGADRLTYDRDLELITATGNVEIVYGDRTLLADKVTYNKKTDKVRAEGNVSLTDSLGQTVFGDKMEITGDLKNGVIFNFGLVLADRAYVAGNGARRTDGFVTEVSKAVYTPCEICAEDPNASPLWQLKAVRVIHNSKEQRVEYRDAWLEVFGVPVAYTPYLAHPDPTVKRRSGLLAPSFSNSSDLGFRAETPYYWAIDEHSDATITPLLTTSAGNGAIGEYRRNFENAIVDVNGSFVLNDDDRDARGYIDFTSEYHIDPTWRAGLNIEASSDDTYMRRYGFYTEPVLVSRAYVEGFRGQNYQVLNAYAFDDLRQEEGLDESPVILPMYDFAYNGRRDQLGGYTSFDFNALNLMRQEGTDTRRIAFRPRWERPFAGYFGELYEFSLALAADGYHTSNFTLDDGTRHSGFAGRLVPQAAFGWRLPLYRPGTTIDQTIEPRASVVVAPNGGNSDKIPNEDSQSVEFDETNLFRENRFDGFDKIDGGTRINYGINWTGIHNENGGNSSVFIGQSYKPRTDSTFAVGSGLEDHFSDFVGKIVINPARYMNLTYRTQISSDNFEPQRNEISTTLGEAGLRLSGQYLFIDSQQNSEFDGREEISGSLSSQFNRFWSGSIAARNDMEEGDWRSIGLQLVYEDECVKFTTQATRSFYEDRDLKPSDTISFTVVLKTLGEVKSGVSQ